MRALRYLGFSTLLFATGCPGGGGGSDPEDLVGTWHQVAGPNDTADELETLAIAANGTYTRSDASGLLDTGTYDADSERVTIHATANGEEHEIDQGYLIDGDQLGVGALFPDGDVDGVVGAWHGELTQDAESIVVDVELSADGSAEYHAVSTAQGQVDFTGTWAVTGTDVGISVAVDGGTITLNAKAMPGKAITDKLYQRQP
jgi:hypothetical protein